MSIFLSKGQTMVGYMKIQEVSEKGGISDIRINVLYL